MRKTIKLMAALSFACATSSSIVACTNPFADENVFRISIVTDGHVITDHSFNESAYNGALKFKSEFEEWINDASSNAPENLRTKKVVITPIQPATTDLNTLISSYGQAVVMRSGVTLATGSMQSSGLVAAQNGMLKHQMRYIYVDGDTPLADVPKENKNLAGLLYQAEQSGLMAAVAAGAWLMAHAADYNNELKVSTYGGLNIPQVTSYMYGYFWGIDLLKQIKQHSAFETEVKSWVKELNPNFEGDLPPIDFVKLENQFTGNFDQASPASKALNGTLVDKGANIIFPVAGPQTSDTISALQSKGTNGKVIGVDTDQALQYTESADYFLTSALKNIVDSVNYMLWRSIPFGYYGFSDDSAHTQLTDEEQKEIFATDAPNRGGKAFVGIADNKAITPIYNKVVTSPELAGFIQKVSDGWAKVLEYGRDYWNYGLSTNPFE